MRLIFGAIPLLFGSLAASAAQSPAPPLSNAELFSRAGYLGTRGGPDSVLLLPAPPAPGSAAQARDEAAAKAAIALRGSPRWDQATRDVNLASLTGTFSCALGADLTTVETPRLTMLLRRAMVDLGRSTSAAKRKYQRARPFMVNAAPLCSPDQETVLRNDGSYPSGHSAIGWGVALLLTELAPDRADQLLARGRAFGQSRVVCNVHWLSDIEEGRLAASAILAKMHSVPEFRADLEAARAELASARPAAPRSAEGMCMIEQAALAGG